MKKDSTVAMLAYETAALREAMGNLDGHGGSDGESDYAGVDEDEVLNVFFESYVLMYNYAFHILTKVDQMKSTGSVSNYSFI